MIQKKKKKSPPNLSRVDVVVSGENDGKAAAVTATVLNQDPGSKRERSKFVSNTFSQL